MVRFRCWSTDLGVAEARAKRVEAGASKGAAEEFVLQHHDEPEDGSQVMVYVREDAAADETSWLAYRVTCHVTVETSARLMS